MAGATIQLDGSGSADPNSGDTLSYSWTKTAGPTISLSASNVARPTFVAPTQPADYQLTFRLTVTDAGGLASTDDVVVNVAVNLAPTANAGETQNVVAGATVTLDGSGSTDPNSDDTLSYSWVQTAGPTVNLSDSDAVDQRLPPQRSRQTINSLLD